jgi:Methane oxygenase PmoA
MGGDRHEVAPTGTAASTLIAKLAPDFATLRRGRGYAEAIVATAAIVIGVSMAAVLSGDTRLAGGTLPEVALIPRIDERRVDVLVDGAPFTAYIWPRTLKKPVLHPIHTAAGVLVTRGFPPEPGERADHPHQVGLWLTYGDVNGYDFWNNSEAIPSDRAPKMGTIVHRGISRNQSGKGTAELDVSADWVIPGGDVILQEVTSFRFHAAPGIRMIDRVTLLRPTHATVAFPDNKEGLLGLRVQRALEDPSEPSGEFVDASGNVTKVGKLDAAGATGKYLSSEDKRGKEVWGTRGRWTMLTGSVGGKPVTVAILDHPDNPGYPTYWHARGYGLFAANPLGQAAFTEGKARLNFTIPSGQSRLFRYRIILLDSIPSPDEMERHFKEWADSNSTVPGRR